MPKKKNKLTIHGLDAIVDAVIKRGHIDTTDNDKLTRLLDEHSKAKELHDKVMRQSAGPWERYGRAYIELLEQTLQALRDYYTEQKYKEVEMVVKTLSCVLKDPELRKAIEEL